jgi:precorrin-2 dehydrogenase / sirohydrochlorin ferrochelatase
MKQQFMPIAIDVANKKILLIGGGKVALHKIESLKNYATNIVVIGKVVDNRIKEAGYNYIEKEYEISDLNDSVLIYACTNIRELNQQVKEDAHKLSKLVNVVDKPDECDFVSPAIYRNKNISVAVSSNGQNVYKSIEIRNIIGDFLNNQPMLFIETSKQGASDRKNDK